MPAGRGLSVDRIVRQSGSRSVTEMIRHRACSPVAGPRNLPSPAMEHSTAQRSERRII
ncbi:MAG: hypothetical protein HYY04_18935 [Chloroflexi bacterium]|nr:hypothetical protein [Chloroflexota bacterium]